MIFNRLTEQLYSSTVLPQLQGAGKVIPQDYLLYPCSFHTPLSGVMAAQKPHKLQVGWFDSSGSDVCQCGHIESFHGAMGCFHERPNFEGDEPISDCQCKSFKAGREAGA